MTGVHYPSYKTSGADWMGEVPSHWTVDRLKWTVDFARNGVWGEEPDGGDEDIVCVRVADFDRVNQTVILEQPTIRKVRKSDQDGRTLQNGDLLLEKSGGGEGWPVGYVVEYIHQIPAVCSNFIARMKPSRLVRSRFLRYLHHALYTARVNVRSIKQTSGIQNLDAASYFNELVPYPPHEEQDAIGASLDGETAKIDALITEQQNLLERLREKRRGTIHTAVTKGLNSDCSFKESGKEWIGLVPTHWNVRKIKYVAKLESGHTPSRQHPEWWIPEECTIPWISLTDVNQFRDDQIVEIIGTNEKVSPVGLANSSARLLPAGTVVVSRTASVGFSVVMGTAMATTQDFANWICGPEIHPHYLLYAFRSMREDFRRLIMGSTHQTIYMPDIASFATPVPPFDEQVAIVEFLRTALCKIDDLIQEVETSNILLQEHRSTLIAAVVTGKIDVREVVHA